MREYNQRQKFHVDKLEDKPSRIAARIRNSSSAAAIIVMNHKRGRRDSLIAASTKGKECDSFAMCPLLGFELPISNSMAIL